MRSPTSNWPKRPKRRKTDHGYCKESPRQGQIPARGAKKAPAKAKVAPAPKKAPEAEKTYTMPQEVKDWIDRANSIMNHQRGEIDRLKQENKELKNWRRWAEDRILKADYE